MGLIIKDKIQQLMKGYPTVSDKYNVAGGQLTGSYPAHFGELVQKSSSTGYFEAINSSNTVSAVGDLGGFVVATNVKLAQDWPGTTVQVNPGEAFNLLVNGFIAVELSANAVGTDITMNAAVYFDANGAITTTSDATKIAAIPNTVFTGLVETQGSKKFAEIYVK